MKYAGIGAITRVPNSVGLLLRKTAKFLAEHEYTLISGHATGCEAEFEAGAYEGNGKVELFLPWPEFNGALGGDVVKNAPTQEALALAKAHSPSWDQASISVRAIYGQQSHLVLGKDLQSPVDFVICWRDITRFGGGVAQALRIAQAYNIPVYDLSTAGKVKVKI